MGTKFKTTIVEVRPHCVRAATTLIDGKDTTFAEYTLDASDSGDLARQCSLWGSLGVQRLERIRAELNQRVIDHVELKARDLMLDLKHGVEVRHTEPRLKGPDPQDHLRKRDLQRLEEVRQKQRTEASKNRGAR